MAKILLVNYKPDLPTTKLSDLPKEKLDKLMSVTVKGAKHIANVPGLRWKIYLNNPETGEVGGIYLFDDEASLKAYLDGPLMTQRKAGKFGDGVRVLFTIRDATIKQFDVMDELTKITRGPVADAVDAVVSIGKMARHSRGHLPVGHKRHGVKL